MHLAFLLPIPTLIIIHIRNQLSILILGCRIKENLMPFINEELKKLSKDIINQALTRPTMDKTPSNLVEKLRQSIAKQTKLPKV
jgi:non-homologous end joining protein Ku